LRLKKRGDRPPSSFDVDVRLPRSLLWQVIVVQGGRAGATTGRSPRRDRPTEPAGDVAEVAAAQIRRPSGCLHLPTGGATRTASPPRWVSVQAMGTPDGGYRRCSGCNEIKRVAADGIVDEHNRYDGAGTSVAILRCPGSGRPPLDADREEIGAARRRA
jgi:hypothetical protein